MSLVSADGSAYKFQPAAEPASQLQSPPPVTTQNSFQFLPSTNDTAAAAAAPALFSSQPINLGAPLTFAPSNPQRPAASATAELDFSEFEAEIASMEESKRQEFLESLAVNAQKIRDEKNGTAALPSQIGDSKLFHSAVLKQYGSEDTRGERTTEKEVTRVEWFAPC